MFLHDGKNVLALLRMMTLNCLAIESSKFLEYVLNNKHAEKNGGAGGGGREFRKQKNKQICHPF